MRAIMQFDYYTVSKLISFSSRALITNTAWIPKVYIKYIASHLGTFLIEQSKQMGLVHKLSDISSERIDL